MFVSGDQRSTTEEPGETGRGRGGHRGMQTYIHTHAHTHVNLHETQEQVCKHTYTYTHTHTHIHTNTHTHKHTNTALPPSNPSDVACSISVRKRQTRANGHTVETGHDGVLTVVPRIVIGTPDGGKTRHRGGGKGGGEG